MIIFIFILINLPIIFTLNPFVWLKVKNKKKRRKKCSSHFPRAMCDVFTLLPLSNQQFKSQSIKRSSTLITLRIKNLEPASVWHFCFMNDWNHLSKQLAIAFLKWCNSGERIVVCSSNSDALGWFSGQSHQRWYLATWGWNKQLSLPLLAAAFNRLIDLMSNHAAHC